MHRELETGSIKQQGSITYRVSTLIKVVPFNNLDQCSINAHLGKSRWLFLGGSRLEGHLRHLLGWGSLLWLLEEANPLLEDWQILTPSYLHLYLFCELLRFWCCTSFGGHILFNKL